MGIKKKTLSILKDGMLVRFEFLCFPNTLENYEELFMKKMKHPYDQWFVWNNN
jgi:hypothetical protein